MNRNGPSFLQYHLDTKNDEHLYVTFVPTHEYILSSAFKKLTYSQYFGYVRSAIFDKFICGGCEEEIQLSPEMTDPYIVQYEISQRFNGEVIDFKAKFCCDSEECYNLIILKNL